MATQAELQLLQGSRTVARYYFFSGSLLPKDAKSSSSPTTCRSLTRPKRGTIFGLIPPHPFRTRIARCTRPCLPCCAVPWSSRSLSLGFALHWRSLRSPARPKSPRKPNVVVILTDDQGYGDFSCHGNPVLKTPNIDRLYARSVRFTDFHVAPMCTPTRGQLHDRLDALRNGAMNVSAAAARSCGPVPDDGRHLRRQRLSHRPFRQMASGRQLSESALNERGFQESIYCTGVRASIRPPDDWDNNYFDDAFFATTACRRSIPATAPTSGSTRRCDWIEERTSGRQTVLRYLPTNAPHGPHWCPKSIESPIAGPRDHGQVFRHDRQHRREHRPARCDACWTKGLRENTIVIFMTDNGGTAGVKVFNAGMRAGKTTLLRGGHRVPLASSAGRRRQAAHGRDVAALTEVQDLLPTLVDLCGLKTPAKRPIRRHQPGRSCCGKTTDELPDRTLVVQYGQNEKRSQGRGRRAAEPLAAGEGP